MVPIHVKPMIANASHAHWVEDGLRPRDWLRGGLFDGAHDGVVQVRRRVRGECILVGPGAQLVIKRGGGGIELTEFGRV